MLKEVLEKNKIGIIQGKRYPQRLSRIYDKEIDVMVSKAILVAKENGIKRVYLNEIKTDLLNHRIIGWWLKKNGIITVKDSANHGWKYIAIDY